MYVFLMCVCVCVCVCVLQVMAEQHPRSLLILDDVWSHAVINAFSVRCRLLVTTRVSGLVSPVMVQNVHQLSVSQGMYNRCTRVIFRTKVERGQISNFENCRRVSHFHEIDEKFAARCHHEGHDHF